MGDNFHPALKERLEKEARRTRSDFERLYQLSAAYLGQRGLKAEVIEKQLGRFSLAVPSWAFSAGGTRFFRFPFPGEPRNIFEKLEDASLVHLLSGMAPRVALHYPWDKISEPAVLKKYAARLQLGFDAMNSNSFQDFPGQKLSYKWGSLCAQDPKVRSQAVRLNLEAMEFGQKLGCNSLVVWLGDGANHPGQMHFRKSFDYYLSSLARIYRRLPRGWKLYLEYKPYEPAFYYTVNFDWGCSFAAASRLGNRCQVLVDLGHHLPGANVEAVVARLIQLGKLGGFHFNDSKYGDDDLTAGSINSFRLFLIMNEMVDAARERGAKNFTPSLMIDQSHNLKDPIEEMLQTCEQLAAAYCRALLVDREALADAQARCDALLAEKILQDAFEAPVRGLLAKVRLAKGGAFDPISFYRKTGYRKQLTERRKKEV
jgi:L-rhamnose isomerase/sugar isomerase